MQIIFLSNHFFFTILATDLKYFKVTSTTIHCNGGVIKTPLVTRLKIETFVPTKLLFFLLTPNNKFNFNLCYLLFYNQYVKYNFEFPKDCNGLLTHHSQHNMYLPYYTCILVLALEYRSVLAIHNPPLECLFHYRPNLYLYLLPFFFLTNCKICFGETSEIAIKKNHITIKHDEFSTLSLS